jgi:hypothetical protein
LRAVTHARRYGCHNPPTSFFTPAAFSARVSHLSKSSYVEVRAEVRDQCCSANRSVTPAAERVVEKILRLVTETIPQHTQREHAWCRRYVLVTHSRGKKSARQSFCFGAIGRMQASAIFAELRDHTSR